MGIDRGWRVAYKSSDAMRDFDDQWTEDDLERYARENISEIEEPEICPHCGEKISYQYINYEFVDAICACV